MALLRRQYTKEARKEHRSKLMEHVEVIKVILKLREVVSILGNGSICLRNEA